MVYGSSQSNRGDYNDNDKYYIRIELFQILRKAVLSGYYHEMILYMNF